MNIHRIKYKRTIKKFKDTDLSNFNDKDGIAIFISITADFLNKINPILDKGLRKYEAKKLYWKFKKGKKVNRQDRRFLYSYLSRRKAYNFKVIENSKVYRRKESVMDPSFMVSMKKEFTQNLEISNAILMISINKILKILKNVGLEVYSIQNIIYMNSDDEFIEFIQLQNRTHTKDDIRNILNPYPELFDILNNNIYGYKFLKKRMYDI